MKVILSPVAGSKNTVVSVNGLIVTVDGQSVDLSQIPDGGQAQALQESPLIGTVTREEVTVRYEYDSAAAESNQPTDIGAYTFDVTTAGEIPSPIKMRA